MSKKTEDKRKHRVIVIVVATVCLLIALGSFQSSPKPVTRQAQLAGQLETEPMQEAKLDVVEKALEVVKTKELAEHREAQLVPPVSPPPPPANSGLLRYQMLD